VGATGRPGRQKAKSSSTVERRALLHAQAAEGRRRMHQDRRRHAGEAQRRRVGLEVEQLAIVGQDGRAPDARDDAGRRGQSDSRRCGAGGHAALVALPRRAVSIVWSE
jgi:hypothetical protein